MMAKRLFDIIVAGILLVFSLPAMAFIAIAIKFDSTGPVIFRQSRVGREGHTFEMLKFRTMVLDAEKLGDFSTARHDPRITRCGRFLRRTSLDELPQLFNVLFGDMSLVGPRPDVPSQRENYTEEEWQTRHRVRPGITGLAQATVRSDAKPGERKNLDLEYVNKASFWLDLKILIWTVRQVVSKGSF